MFVGVMCAGAALALSIVLACDSNDRSAQIEALAAPLGLRYAPALAPAEAEALRALPSMSKRKQNFFTEALVSQDLLVFDWTWREGPLKERNRESQTVVAVRLPGRALPAFVWAARGVLAREELRPMGGGMEFADAPSFSDRFEVAGRDRAALRRLFEPAGREGLTLPDELRVEGHGDWLVGYRLGTQVAPAQIEIAIDEMRALARALE